jgi:hypothetical protein
MNDKISTLIQAALLLALIAACAHFALTELSRPDVTESSWSERLGR